MEIKWNRNCKEYNGVYACDILKSEGYNSCNDCDFYEPRGKKIFIIKLGASGDVLRTTPILKAIKKKYGSDCHITWLTKDFNRELLYENELIDEVITLSEDIMRLKYEQFDVLFNFEIDTPATLIAREINAVQKFGYFFDSDGHPSAYNPKAEFYLNRALSDKINKSNTKTYQEMIFEIAELDYNQEDYILNLTDDEKELSVKLREPYKGLPIIGVVVGAGSRWPSKQWDRDNLIGLIKKLRGVILLLSGPNEPEGIQQEIVKELKNHQFPIMMNNPHNTLREFISAVNACDLFICGDSLALHIALALQKKTVGLFFCTPDWEVEGYGRLKKLVSPLLMKHFYTDEKVKELGTSITIKEVIEKVKEFQTN
ncbi:MAG: glycosyltransferase family 9 protein [Nanoarchaeota archaeon]